MKIETQKIFAETLGDLADVYGARRPSDGALKIWRDAMSGIEDKSILIALRTWADHGKRFPTPAELREKALHEEIKSREAEIQRTKIEQNHFKSRKESVSALSPTFQLALKRAFVYIEVMKQHKDGQWKWNLLNEMAAGKPLLPIQISHLQRALGHSIGPADFEQAARHKDPYPIIRFSEFLRKAFEETGATPNEKEQAILDEGSVPVIPARAHSVGDWTSFSNIEEEFA